MLEFDYNKFKTALKRVEEEKFTELEKDVNKVKDFIEKALTLSLESSSNRARTSYPGLEL